MAKLRALSALGLAAFFALWTLIALSGLVQPRIGVAREPDLAQRVPHLARRREARRRNYLVCAKYVPQGEHRGHGARRYPAVSSPY